MGVKVTNNAFGTLSAAINTTATTVTLDSGQGARFPTLGANDYFYGTLVDTSNNLEIVKVTARSTDSLTVVRGQDGTTAASFAIGDRFELRPVAALFEEFAQTGGGTITSTQSFDTTNELAAVFDRSNDGDIVSFKNNGTEVAKVAVASSDNVMISAMAGGGGGLMFWGAGGTDPKISPLKEGVMVDDEVDFGRASERFRNLWLSGGLYIGGTGNANKFSDYEVGTYTIQERHGQAPNLVTNRCNYVKIGDLVYVSASVSVGSTSNGNVLNLTLPFTSTVSSYFAGNGSMGYSDLASTYQNDLRPVVENGADNVLFYYGTGSTLKCSNASSKRIDFTVFYKV